MIKRFGLDIYDKDLELKVWEVGQDMKFLKLCNSTLYVKNLEDDWDALIDDVIYFSISSLLMCVCSREFTLVYSFDLESVLASKLKMQKVVAGARHFIAIDSLGRSFGLGSNLHGQLGIYDMEVSDWKINHTLEGLKVIDIAAGDLFSLFLTESGIVFACGNNDFGQLGIPLNGFENIGQNIPKPVFESNSGLNMQIAAGSRHSLILVGKKVFGSGWSKYGQLGVKKDQIRGFMHIFADFLVSNVDANYWETVLDVAGIVK